MSESPLRPSSLANLGGKVRDVLFVTAGVSYAFVVVDLKVLGLANYLVFLGVALKMGLFARVKAWPRLAHVGLLSGPLLIGSGLVYSTDLVGYWTLLPIVPYVLVCQMATNALMKAH